MGARSHFRTISGETASRCAKAVHLRVTWHACAPTAASSVSELAGINALLSTAVRGLVPGIHDFLTWRQSQDVDSRDKPGHEVRPICAAATSWRAPAQNH